MASPSLFSLEPLRTHMEVGNLLFSLSALVNKINVREKQAVFLRGFASELAKRDTMYATV